MSPTTARARRRSSLRPAALAVGLVSALAAGLLAAVPAAGATPYGVPTAPHVTAQEAARVAAARAAMPDLGDHVVVVDPTMTTAAIQAAADAITAQQVDDEMGPGRWALLFLPGSYGSTTEPLHIQVGYGTEVAGLGRDPGDVQVTGKIEVFNRCLAPDNCIALDNFWRSLANLTIHVAGGDGCRASANFWAVSQASPMRRVQVDGNLSLMDYCTAGPQYASGGFIADSRTSTVTNGSQQQFLVRDSSIGTWSNGVWNQVFSGVEGAPAQSFPSTDPGPYTTLDTTPVSRERPYLFVDDTGAWNLLVPDARTGSRGPTWSDTTSTPGTVVPLSAVHVAHPGDSVASMNAALRAGRHLLLTPGQYDVPQSITVNGDRQVLLGLGLPALTAVGGAVPVVVKGMGADVAGIMVDAGTTTSPALVRVGEARSRAKGETTPPTALQDVFFRVGGPHAGRAGTALKVTADDVVLDDIWAWRADHGQGVGWTVNPADHGVVVTGDRVTATGLFAEHFEKDNVVWSGEDGRTVFFQNELPYDAPDQASWRHGRTLGYAGYKVDPTVQRHELWGGGVYVFTNVNPSLHASSGFSVPVTPGVRLHDLLTVNLGAGTIDHVVNDVGAPVSSAAIGVPSFVTSYP
ncbi:adenylyl cyclase [Lapillicoccus jejuensis]|uniref:Pectate lyase-like protein n=1 Tax=Lapillicoccus jejuensis TaxID=402171 RepID=A0A542E3P6_9MICO|nr:adenylyl cyclase [Lapillicoccus jejuensis]TQJ09874.1 hypothetical protein FB458_2990 [Lapillicoccus jejuensis]